MLGLIIFSVLETELPYLGLAVTALLPTYLRTLVTSDVDIFLWEKLCNLCNYIFKEYHRAFLTGTDHVV